MKKRNNYVSNSSSSSCIVYDWNLLNDLKKDMILNPYKYVVQAWKQANCKFVCNDKFQSGHLEQHDEILDFGFLGEWWRNKYNVENDTMEFTTLMDNFNLLNWLNYIGGVKYKDTGENFGLFADEELTISSDEFAELFEKASKTNNKH